MRRFRRDFLGVVRARDLNRLVDEVNRVEARVDGLAVGEGYDLPETDPEVAGQLWNNAGTVTVSDGPT